MSSSEPKEEKVPTIEDVEQDLDKETESQEKKTEDPHPVEPQCSTGEKEKEDESCGLPEEKLPSTSRDESPGPIMPPKVIHSVSYAVFDTAVGNTIEASFPTDVDLPSILDTKSVADYCFPDGAHDFFSSCVCISLRLKEGVEVPSFVPSNQRHIYGFATYHLKRDPTAHRGAYQRSMLILSWSPLYEALSELAKVCIFPFFEAVHFDDKTRHLEFCQHLHDQLRGCFGAAHETISVSLDPKGDGTHHLLGRRQRSRSDSKFGAGASNLTDRFTLNDYLHCGTRAVTIQLLSLVKPQIAAREPDPMSRDEGPADDSGEPIPDKKKENPPPASDASVLGVSGRSYVAVPKEVHMRLPLAEASALDQFSYGASVRNLMKWLGSNAAVVHWSFLCRIPVLFVGARAEEVGEAVRACAHLLRPMRAVDVSRFAPFATIEHSDYLRNNVSCSPYLALGSTNAYLRETDFAGVVKCDIMSGSVKFSTGKEPKLPKKIKDAFNVVLQAANDDHVKEIYLRSKLARLNMGILQQFRRKEGAHYDCLKASSNLIETPMGKLEEEETLTQEEGGGSFLLVGEDNYTAPGSPTSPHAAAGDFNDEVDEEVMDSDGSSPTSPTSQSLIEIRALHTALLLYKESVVKNNAIVKDLENWYAGILHLLKYALYNSSGMQQQALFDDLEAFSIEPEKLRDPSTHFCGSSVVEALETQQSLERAQRLRFSVDFKERCFLLVDNFCRNNPRVLRRKGNRMFSDFFNFPDCALYGFPTQVLFLKSSGTIVTYHNRVKSTTSGTFYLSKNFLCFEAGALAIKKRHQIFPFDAMSAISQERNGPILTPTIKVMLEEVIMACVRGEGAPVPGGGEADGAGGTTMVVISNLGTSDGFFEMLQLLFHRQKRLHKMVRSIPNLIGPCPKPRIICGGMICPLIIPAGLYTSVRQEQVEEVWENQRSYPIIGWSNRLLLSDPPGWSDFSGKRERKMESVALPEGFEWCNEWAIKEGPVKDLFEDDEETGSRGQHMDPAASPPSSPKGAADRGFLYATTWFTTDFKNKTGFGTVIRRRLWTRRRRLIPPPEGVDESSQQTLEAILASGELPREVSVSKSPITRSLGDDMTHAATAGGSVPTTDELLATRASIADGSDDDLSANSSDMVLVEKVDEVLAPLQEEDNDRQTG